MAASSRTPALVGLVQRRVALLSWCLLALVFVADVQGGASTGVGLLYVPVMLMGLAAPGARWAIRLAAVATLLTAINLAFFHPVAELNQSLIDRALAWGVLWITAVGVTMYRLSTDRNLESLRALEDIRQALDQSAIVAVTDVPGRIKFVNEKFCEISKYSRDELLGQDHRILNSAYHPPEFMRDLWVTIANGRVWRGEIRNRAKDGSIYWVDTTIVPFLDARGKPWQYMAIRYDITDRKAQEQRLRDQAALAALGEFAAVVAHEVRNPLFGIRNGVQLMSADLPPGSDGVDLGREIVSRIDGLNVVIEDLLTFARPRDIRPSRLNMRLFLSGVVTMFRHDPAMRGVEVLLDAPEEPTIEADPDQLRLLFTNLLVNAGQAMNGDGTIALEVALDAALGWVFTVRDHGPGIPEATREKIFEPFYTTKHRGTGLGLPTVKRVVEAHHGTIAIEAPEGGGTIVRVVLPARQPLLAVAES